MKAKAEIRVMPLQGISRISGHLQKLKERHGTDSPSQPLERVKPADTLILDFWPFKNCRETKPIVLSYIVCGNLLGSPRKQIQAVSGVSR